MERTDNQIKEYALSCLRTDTILSGGIRFLSECKEIQDSEKAELFMTTLMNNSLSLKESKHIVVLFHEAMPRLRKLYMEKVLVERIKMHVRLADWENLKICYFQIPIRWARKMWISPKFDVVKATK